MNLTFYGHSCFLAEIGGTKVLFDPFITPNPKASEIDIQSIQPDYILVSHGHADHVADVEEIMKGSSATLISNFEICNWFEAKGIEKTVAMNHGGCAYLPFGSVKMVNAIHSSSMPDGSYGGNPAGFVIESAEKTFYFAGDTGLTYDMKLIADQYGKLDFAILPIGDNFTMGIDDAIICSNFVNTNTIVGMHYDTFPPIEIDHLECSMKCKSANKELVLIEIGDSRRF